jgi:hypothetical protein
VYQLLSTQVNSLPRLLSTLPCRLVLVLVLVLLHNSALHSLELSWLMLGCLSGFRRVVAPLL